jgi:hypothetical protein
MRGLIAGALVVLSFGQAACIGLRGGLVPSQTPPLGSGEAQLSVSIVLKGRALVNNEPTDVPTIAVANWTDNALKAYRESGFFAKVSRSPAKTDLVAEIEIVDRGEANFAMAFLSGLTFTILPSTAWDEFTVSTVFKDQDGNVLGEYENRERVTMWIQLLLILGMPFAFPGSVASDALSDVHYKTLQDAYRDAIF